MKFAPPFLWKPIMRSHFAAAVAVRCAALVFLLASGSASLGQPSGKAKPKSAAPQQPATPTLPSTKCIGVVSAIGDTFSLRKIGLTVFGNDLNKVPIEAWQIDDLVVSKISTFLSKSWTVRRISYPRGAFGSLDEEHPLFYNYDEDLAGIVRRVSSSTPCDHYVVVVKGGSAFGETNQGVHGLGILEHGAPLRIADLLYALYTIRIYDGQSFAVLGRQNAVTEEPSLLGNFGKPIRGPYLKVDTSWWPDSGTPSPMVKDGIRSLVAKSLDVTMPLILRVE
jgi:hypothetical protein